VGKDALNMGGDPQLRAALARLHRPLYGDDVRTESRVRRRLYGRRTGEVTRVERTVWIGATWTRLPAIALVTDEGTPERCPGCGWKVNDCNCIRRAAEELRK
jgi:hypothetical protein